MEQQYTVMLSFLFFSHQSAKFSHDSCVFVGYITGNDDNNNRIVLDAISSVTCDSLMSNSPNFHISDL